MKIKIITNEKYLRYFGFFLFFLFSISSLSYAQGDPNKLFTSLTGSEGLAFDQPSEPYIKRSRPVTLNLASLSAATPRQATNGELNDSQSSNQDASQASSPAEPVLLNLFPDVDLLVAFDDLRGNKSGSTTWRGKVEGNTNSLILLVVKDGVMIGNITVGTTQYQVRYLGNNTHVIHEIDQAGFPPEADPDPVQYPSSPDTNFLNIQDAPALDSSALDGRETKRVIDVMVMYTDDVLDDYGAIAINNLIDLAITETNTGYTNSGVNQELNLVHTEMVEYAESGNIQLDRDRLKNPSDGFMDGVHALRDTYGADLVPLIVDNGGGYCGIAYIMTTVSTQFEDSGFCIVADSCATGYYSFGHELGHIMGARHDWYVDSTDNSPHTYNHALTNPTDSWRTIMAYNSACTAAGKNCTRLLYWSNPDETYGDDDMGTREGLTEPKDNRKTLTNTGSVVSNFRVKDASAEPSHEFTSGAVPDNGQDGTMFDLRARRQTTIHGLSTVFTTSGTIERVEVYYKEGSYSGYQNNSSAWKLAGSANNFAVQASPAQTHIPIDLDINIPAGQTYAFYVTTTASSIDLGYSDGSSEGAAYASNESLELMEGRGIVYPFGMSFTPRVFAGTIHHSFAQTPSNLETVSETDNAAYGVMFDIKAKNKITIKAFDTLMGVGIIDKMEVWYRQGTHVGHEGTSADWTLLGSVDNVVASSSFNGPSFVFNRIPIELNLELTKGMTYGFYITKTNNVPPSVAYKNGTSVGAVAAVNGDMEILEGTGKTYPFAASFTPRVFAGTVHYMSDSFPWPMFLPGITNSK